MTPEDFAAKTTPAVSGMASYFMLDGNTYKAGAEQGYSGLDFYAGGRAGVLGSGHDEQAVDSSGFMEPDRSWLDQARAVAPPAQTSAAFMACAYAWADQHLGDDVDWSRLAELLGRVNAAADADGLPLFDAWRSAPEPTDGDPKVLALHRFQVLRELRNEIHVDAVRDAGLAPVEAVALRSPAMGPMFGWPELPRSTRPSAAATPRPRSGPTSGSRRPTPSSTRPSARSWCRSARPRSPACTERSAGGRGPQPQPSVVAVAQPSIWGRTSSAASSSAGSMMSRAKTAAMSSLVSSARTQSSKPSGARRRGTRSAGGSGRSRSR